MNAADLIIAAVLTVTVIFALRKVLKNRRNRSCGCGCSGGTCEACARKAGSHHNNV